MGICVEFLLTLVINSDINMFTLSNGYIYFSHYCDDDRARVSSGIKSDRLEKGWGNLKKSERSLLNRVDDAATAHIESCRRSKAKLLKTELEKVVLDALGRPARGKSGFEEDFKQMLEDMKSGKMLHPKKKTRYSRLTIIGYGQCLKTLQRYQSQEKINLSYNLDVDWVNNFIAWMAKPGIRERKFRGGKTKMIEWAGHSQNSIGNTMRYIKGFLGHTYGKKHSNLLYKHNVFNVPQEETEAEALSIPEIETIYKMQFESDARNRARDVMVYGCWVGLRSEDLRNINNYQLKGGKFEFFNQKTGETVIIPAHPVAKEIWEKYNGILPVFDQANLNIHMKQICKEAGFTEQCMFTITRGGVKRVEYYEKWEMISPHTLRRSFATNAVKAGIPDRKVMLFTGHTTETSFRKYLRLKKKENAAELADHSFFTGNTPNS
jgi:integrase